MHYLNASQMVKCPRSGTYVFFKHDCHWKNCEFYEGMQDDGGDSVSMTCSWPEEEVTEELPQG